MALSRFPNAFLDRSAVRSGIERNFTGILAKRELSLQDDDALVRLVPVRRDHMVGGKSHQQFHAASLWIVAQHHRLGPRSIPLFMRPLRGVEVGHDRVGRRLASRDRKSSRDGIVRMRHAEPQQEVTRQIRILRQQGRRRFTGKFLKSRMRWA